MARLTANLRALEQELKTVKGQYVQQVPPNRPGGGGSGHRRCYGLPKEFDLFLGGLRCMQHTATIHQPRSLIGRGNSFTTDVKQCRSMGPCQRCLLCQRWTAVVHINRRCVSVGSPISSICGITANSLLYNWRYSPKKYIFILQIDFIVGLFYMACSISFCPPTGPIGRKFCDPLETHR